MTTCTLAECPIGLFIAQGGELADSGELCLKTEYGNNDGRIDAYIVSTGEFFWGTAPQTIASQRAQIVTPVENVTLHTRPVAFRVEVAPERWTYFDNEEWAAEYADKHGLDYEGLYTRKGDGLPQTAGDRNDARPVSTGDGGP